jgi:hypothetical protein
MNYFPYYRCQYHIENLIVFTFVLPASNLISRINYGLQGSTAIHISTFLCTLLRQQRLNLNLVFLIKRILRFLHFLYIRPQNPHLFVLVVLKIEPVLPAKSDLHQIVIQRLLTDTDLISGLVEGEADGLLLVGVVAVV